MLECRRIRLLWGLSEIFKRVIKIFWGEVFMVRNTMKTGQPFLVTISEAFSRRSDCGYSAKRCEQKKKHKKTRGWGGEGRGVWARELEVPYTLRLPLFLLFFFLALFLRAALHYRNAWHKLQFRSRRFSSTTRCGNASFWLVLILTDQSLLARAEYVLYCSTLQKTGHRLSAWNKRNHRTRKKTSASDLTANFHSIFRNYFFPSHSVSLGRSQGCFPFTKIKFNENPVEKWMEHWFSCRSSKKFTGATDHLKR